MFGIFEKLQDIAERLGTVEEAHMYNNGTVTIDVTGNGKKYHISMFVRENKKVCYEMLSGEMIAKSICLVFFFVMPTEMVDWPSGQFEINNVFDWATQLIYDMDEPNNLFPSIHCLESWVVTRGAFWG